MIEREIKLRVESHEGVRKRLIEVGAARIGRFLEFNQIFDRPDGSLRAVGCGLRVRSVSGNCNAGRGQAPSPPSPLPGGEGYRPSTLISSFDKENAQQSSSENCPCVITLKGPVMNAAVKSREEIEVPVQRVEAAVRLLRGLGFVPILTYEKRRESWRQGECKVELDEPPHIGLFVEIEGPDEEAIRGVQDKLGLGGVPDVRPSYVAMLIEYCERNGIADRTLRVH